jgi:hypothetical protein
VPRNAVGPTAEYLAYGDMVYTSTKRNLSKQQFHTSVEVNAPSIDNGWYGPLGSYGEPNSGGAYGYGVSSSLAR